jgi:hypothetical protein
MLCHLVAEQQPLHDWEIHNYEISEEQLEHYVQTRMGKGRTQHTTNNTRSLKNRNAVVVDPIVNWIGKQLEGQTVPQTIILDRLQSNHSNFPSGILVLPTDDGRLPRILICSQKRAIKFGIASAFRYNTPSTLKKSS